MKQLLLYNPEAMPNKERGNSYERIVGVKYGMLRVDSVFRKRIPNKETRVTWALCTCDCGSTKEVHAASLVANLTKSCGCMWRKWAGKARAKPTCSRGHPTPYDESKKRKCCEICKADHQAEYVASGKKKQVMKSYKERTGFTYSKAHRMKDPEKATMQIRARILKKYGLTNEDYSRMLKEQGGTCKICKTSNPGGPGSKLNEISFSVDHCHKTGNVRSLLCLRCNRVLGASGDSVEWLAEALQYLKEHNGRAISTDNQSAS